MATLPIAFDTNTAPPPRDDFEVVPAGEYTAIITDSSMKDTKTGGGKYLELAFQIVDGPAKGRKVWARLNLVNQNAQAVEIAQRDLSAICAAVGHVGPLADSVLLHNKPLTIRVSVELADGNRRKSDQNEIKAYKAIGGTTASVSAAPAPAAATGQAPWQRSAA